MWENKKIRSRRCVYDFLTLKIYAYCVYILFFRNLFSRSQSSWVSFNKNNKLLNTLLPVEYLFIYLVKTDGFSQNMEYIKKFKRIKKKLAKLLWLPDSENTYCVCIIFFRNLFGWNSSSIRRILCHPRYRLWIGNVWKFSPIYPVLFLTNNRQSEYTLNYPFNKRNKLLPAYKLPI